MGYKLLGIGVWKVGKWFLRRKYGAAILPAAVAGGGALLAISGVTLARRRRNHLPAFQTTMPRSLYAMAQAYPSRAETDQPPSRRRRAMRDCSDHSSMKPGDACCENRPPDSANVASWAS